MSTVILRKRYGHYWFRVNELVQPHTYLVDQVMHRLGPQPVHTYWDWVIRHITYPYGHPAWDDMHTEQAFWRPTLWGRRPKFFYRQADYWEFPGEVLRDRVGDCFTGDTEILCIEQGEYKRIPIRDLESKVGQVYALSYNWETDQWEPKLITKFWRQGVRKVVQVTLRNGTQFRVTPDHRFFTHRYGRLKVKNQQLQRTFEEKSLRDIEPGREALACARQIPALDAIPQASSHLLWLEGAYVAEGWHDPKTGGHLCIASDNPLYRQETLSHLTALGASGRESKRQVHAYVSVHKSWVKDHLWTVGFDSYSVHMFPRHLSGNPEQLETWLDGYARGDGYLHPVNTCQGSCRMRVYNTQSDQLAKDLRLVHLILGRPLHVGRVRDPRPHRQTRWMLTENTNSLFNRPIRPDIGRVSIKSVEEVGEEEVFDITVADNHNFLLADSQVLAHNCKDSAALLTSMLRHVLTDRQVYMSVGYYQDRGHHHLHAWTTIFLPDGTPLALDTTYKTPLAMTEWVTETPHYQPFWRANDHRTRVLQPVLARQAYGADLRLEASASQATTRYVTG